MDHLKTRRVPSSDGEEEQIKSRTEPLMLSATPKFQAQLSEALAVIGNHDLHKLSPDLLPELKSSLETAINANDFASVNGILATVNSLFEKFRHQFKSDPNYSVDNFDTLLSSDVERKINAAPGSDSVATLEQLLQSLNIGSESVATLEQLLLSLKISDVPENIADEWMNKFKNFLTVSDSVDHDALYDNVEQLTQSIVIPQLMLRDEDEELFKMNHAEFIKRDMDESDLDHTRRRIAFEHLKGIAGIYKQNITDWVIQNCLTLFAKIPDANSWKYKECAIYVALSSVDLIDVQKFFESVIVPELRCEDVNAFPMLKAAALKFFTVFRISPKPKAMSLLGDVARFLGSDFYVVRSYAASCIEKLLLVKDNNGVRRYTSSDINPIHGVLMGNLFGALERNEYIMRCMMHVFQIADISPEMAPGCIYKLTGVIARIRENHDNNNNPVFNHFLFEAVAAYVKRACENNHSLVPIFMTQLVSSLLTILDTERSELYPYAYQLLAQIVDFIRPHVPFLPNYMVVFDKMLSRPGLLENNPAPVDLLLSYLQRASNEVINKEGRLRRVLWISNNLVSSPNTEEQGFRILNTVVRNYRYDVIARYVNHILASLFTRLHRNKTPTLVRCLIIFMSLFLVNSGVQTLVDLVGVNLFHHVILPEFWIPNLKTVSTGYNYMEVKLCAVASTKLLCESASLLGPTSMELWGKLLDAIVTLLSLPHEVERVDDDDDDDDDELDLTGYQGSKFVRLHNVGKKKEDDALKEIEDPKQFLVAFLANLSRHFHGKFPPVIMRYLSPPNQANTCHAMQFLRYCHCVNNNPSYLK